ncbi:MAG: hypothetical protein AB7G39_05630 [Alphaproteobacteria bacterium]
MAANWAARPETAARAGAAAAALLAQVGDARDAGDAGARLALRFDGFDLVLELRHAGAPPDAAGLADSAVQRRRGGGSVTVLRFRD